MLNRLRAADPAQPLPALIFYRVCYAITHAVYTLIYRYRVFGARNVPATGPLLIVANHQSHLDPPAIGLALRDRHMASLARESLFRPAPLAWLIRALGAIPIKLGSSDTQAMRTAIVELQKGRAILIFPEGARTLDGDIGEFKRGVWLLLARSQATVLPVAIEGAYDAWPRSRLFPRLFGCRIAVVVGRPIPHEQLSSMRADEGLEHLREEIACLRARAARCLGSATRFSPHRRLRYAPGASLSAALPRQTG